MFSCQFAAYFQSSFYKNIYGGQLLFLFKEIIFHSKHSKAVTPSIFLSEVNLTTYQNFSTLDAGLWMLNLGCWISKQWRYINHFIFEFFIDKNLWSFQVWKFIYGLPISGQFTIFNHLKIWKARGFQRFSDDMDRQCWLEMN